MIEVKDKSKRKSDDQEDYDLNKQIVIFEEKTGKNFSEFYQSYLPKLIYHNTKIVQDDDVAKDVAMEAFLKSLRKIDTYNPDKAGFSTWLFTISKNDCLHWKSNNNKTVSMDKFVDDEGTTIKDFLHDKNEELSEMKELDSLSITKGNILIRKIGELKNPYRNVIKLRDLDKKTYREITIILRENNNISITSSFFDDEHYDGKTNILSLVDPEKKQDNELIKFHTIEQIVDIGSGNPIKYEIVELDKNKLVSKISIQKGEYFIKGETPFNMSTLKSQIRNGRMNLQKMVKSEFEKLDRIHLH